MKTPVRFSILMAAAALGLSACVFGDPAPDVVAPGGDQAAFKPCRVEDYQSYVGRNRSEIPAAPEGQTFRVLCTTCAATMDYRENRVNFVFDQASGIVREVKCG